MDAHYLVCIVKDLALELGRTPTSEEVGKRIKGFKHHMMKCFGSYALLIQAASLAPVIHLKDTRITNAIFEKDLASHLEAYTPRPVVNVKDTRPTLIISDTHFPWVSKRVLDAIYEWANKYKPERVVQIGDLYDMYAHSKFPRSQNIYQPKQEEELGRKGAQEMWVTIKSIVPSAECVGLVGNHDIRALRRTLESLPSLEHVIEKYLEALMTFDGVRLITDPREEYVADGVTYMHGYKSRIGEHLSYNLANTVHGHTHRGGTTFKRIAGATLWELDVGFAGDVESKVFHYTPTKSSAETPGFGWVDSSGPRFVLV